MKQLILLALVASTTALAEEGVTLNQVHYEHGRSLPSGTLCVIDESGDAISAAGKEFYLHTTQTLNSKHATSCSSSANTEKNLYGEVYEKRGDRYYKIKTIETTGNDLKLAVQEYKLGYFPRALFIQEQRNNSAGHNLNVTAWVYEGDKQFTEIHHDALSDWTNSELLTDQYIDWDKINFTQNKITFNSIVLNEGDYQHPANGSLWAELMLEKEGKTYQLVPIKRINYGKGRYFNAQGVEQYNNNNYDAAAQLFQKAVQHNFREWTSWANLGRSLLEMARYEESIAASKQVLEADKTKPKQKAHAAYTIGQSFERQNDMINARKYYRMAYRLAPSEKRKEAVERTLQPALESMSTKQANPEQSLKLPPEPIITDDPPVSNL